MRRRRGCAPRARSAAGSSGAWQSCWGSRPRGARGRGRKSGRADALPSCPPLVLAQERDGLVQALIAAQRRQRRLGGRPDLVVTVAARLSRRADCHRAFVTAPKFDLLGRLFSETLLVVAD